MTQKSGYDALLGQLDHTAKMIREIEAEADQALHVHKDKAAYRALMRQKAKVLSTLYETHAGMIAGFTCEWKDDAESCLSRFSKNALNAMKLDSVFYMANLLYNDEHGEGEPNHLEELLERIRENIRKEQAAVTK